jgi:Cof subfamily protein (haloacid dehalogenase superfamily)
MIKAVFFDIDGTLVPFKSHSVPESTRRAIHEIRVKGVKVFICTGRPIQFIDNLEGVEYDGMVTVTGALCIDAEGHIISCKYIPRNNVESLLEYLKPQMNPTPFMAVAKDKMYANNLDREDVLDIVNFLNVPNLNYLPLEEALNDEILQLIGFFREDEEVFLKKNVLKDCNPMRWHELFADVVAGNVSKSAGIDAMIDHYGIDLSETMAFGDGGNDILMLDHVAIGIAMGNAGDKVKEHADYITDDADKDGILHALQHFGLLE